MLWNSKVKTITRILCLFLIVFAGIGLSSCDMALNYQKPDRASNMEIQDFRDGLAERLPETEEEESKTSAAEIPSLQPYIASGTESMSQMPLVSVSVNQSVPVRDVLFELAEQAEYDLELDPRIQGSIIFTARNKPFDQVIERISDIAGLRYKFEDNFLRVELDEPYNQIYKVDYLSYIRSNTSGVSTDVSVLSGDASAGSSFSASSESTADFWGELEVNLAQILGDGQSRSLRTNADPRITAVDENPDVQAVAPQPPAGQTANATTDANGNIQVQPPEAVLRVESLPVDDVGGATAASGTASEVSFTLNRQAGIINVFANSKKQKEVENYLTELRRSVTAQVLIEAKVFEVELRDEYSTGINWRALKIGNESRGALSFLPDGISGLNSLATTGSSAITSSSFVLGYAGNDFQALIDMVAEFGTVRALASPRLTVMNNQSAVLNVATNRVFFDIDIETTTEEGVTTVDVDSEVNSIPEGVLVNVLPSVNLQNRTISLAVRPTVTRVLGEGILDPAVAFVVATTPAAEGLESRIPEVNVQEIDTVVQVRSGQPIVMGGLLQDRSDTEQAGVPVLDEVPVIGSLFRTHGDTIRKSELVIFLKATLLDSPDESIHDTDRDLYKAFSGDRRPLKL